ncbi:MAG: hypothetical protein COX57_07525 [Alphaproteobacteria bacterium CG_4_10_14_0_2_um_filter_63_37]|nr:MAG: hypothetical protein AUJ55_00745 [Proteobacteria bacterium CG1_02_64_396]PJA24605.1 MAG: hypothetical protein COX57_07525 [Alphaproteobacteria bacterium CG_4_10_14_0_2_um_filter_63_37]
MASESRLIVSAQAQKVMQEQAEQTYPHECCGLLVGRSSKGVIEAFQACPVDNLNNERAHDRFDLDPQGFQRVDRQARAEKLEIVGVYHSHPDHPARPSETDRQSAWEGYAYWIGRVTQQGLQEGRAYLLWEDGAGFDEIAVEVSAD